MNYSGTERLHAVSYNERENRKKHNPIFRAAKLAASIGGSAIRHPDRTILGIATLTVGWISARFAYDLIEFSNRTQIENSNNLASRFKEIRVPYTEYDELEDYLYHVLNGQPVGPEGKTIAPLLPENKFITQIRPLPVSFPTMVDEEDGLVNRWLPVKDDLTKLPKETWKNKGDLIKGGSFLVTLIHEKPDGSVLITESIARRTSQGWEFNASKHTENHVTEVLVRFPNH